METLPGFPSKLAESQPKGWLLGFSLLAARVDRRIRRPHAAQPRRRLPACAPQGLAGHSALRRKSRAIAPAFSSLLLVLGYCPRTNGLGAIRQRCCSSSVFVGRG